MHADLSRWTFDPHDAYRAVLLQQGRVLLDADWNEQAQITARHDEVRTRDVVGAAGGPLDGAGFALVDGAGARPAGTPWADLRVAPGRYYVDGVLAEASPPGDGGPGHRLADQPFLRAVGDLPGLPEPAEDGRYAAVLDVWSHHVTADEVPRLREAALGGPDTTTRLRTVWQVRLVPVPPGARCTDVVDPLWAGRTPPTMTASLQEVDPAADPCRISTSGGYRRLENQLYRVQVHDVDEDGDARYVWSRENGSVVAGLVDIAAPSASAAAAGMQAELLLDRVGRDDELTIDEGDVVEVTSTDRQLHGLPGHLATAGTPAGLALPVRWEGAGPTDVDALGRWPIVRRWDGPPRPANASPDELDAAGIFVAFGAGDFRPGDHWLVPARTVRLVYGVSALSGTIDWPRDGAGVPAPRPPLGPVHHVAAVAVLDRATVGTQGRWSVAEDCRRLSPPVTELVTLDLLGGDGQSAPSGQPLPERVRVVVRNGGLPVVGAWVRFQAAAGHLALGVPTVMDPSVLDVQTDAHGHADVRWLLPATGSATHVLTARRLDDTRAEVDAQVRVTGRRDEEGCTCVVVRPGTDLVRLLGELSGRSSLVLCLTAGQWDLTEPAVLRGVEEVHVSGVGTATRVVSQAGSALRFEGCGRVQVRDLLVAARWVRDEVVDGALTVVGARRVLAERVRARTGSGPVAVSAGILVRTEDVDRGAAGERAVVRDCLVEVGDLQTGILVDGMSRADVSGCEVVAFRGKEDGDEVAAWLRDEAFARAVARRAVHELGEEREGRLGVRTGFSVVIAVAGVEFGSEIDDANGWARFVEQLGVQSIEEIREAVAAELINPQVQLFAPGGTFADWLEGVERDLRAGPAAGAGIVVTGPVTEDARVGDNTVRGALQGISVAAAAAEGEKAPVVRRLWVGGNTVAPPLRAATGFLEQGVHVGACGRLDVHSTVVVVTRSGRDRLGYPVEGLRCAGELGLHALAVGNTFEGVPLGIRVTGPGRQARAQLHVARDNLCTTGPVLVDATGLWRDEGNVGL